MYSFIFISIYISKFIIYNIYNPDSFAVLILSKVLLAILGLDIPSKVLLAILGLDISTEVLRVIQDLHVSYRVF